jgi:glycosyltransferase involved in cell wall biosynthesis
VDGKTSNVAGPLELSLVIPAYNEAQRLKAGFVRLTRAIDDGALKPQTTEFIFVDDGSTDGTAACAESLFKVFSHTKVIRQENNRGKGAAVRAGVALATAPAIIFADADMAIDPIQIPQFIAALEKSHMAIGSRAATGASVDRPSVTRSVMNRTFNHFVNAVTHLHLDDTQCGFKAFRGPVARLLFHCSSIERMAFDVELLGLARGLGLSIAQVPVHWSRVEGSRVRSWSDSGSMVRDVLRARKTARSAPPVAGSRVTLRSNATASEISFLRELAMTLPVVHLGANEFLVLYPLASDEEVTTRAAAVADRQGLTPQKLESISTTQLRELAPLALNWDDSSLSSSVI